MGNWDAKIFINEKYEDTIKLENNDSLKTIREKSFPKIALRFVPYSLH